jgi:ribonuclease P/MRP protein subunit RPP40
VLNGQQSSWGEIVSGVIQGSCLGPALFLVFINDIDTAVDLTSSFLSKIADDTKMASIVETEDDRKKFQEGVDGLATWSKDWQLLFNVGKCKVMHFGARNKKFHYTMDGVRLEEVEVEKDVGVLVADNLRTSQQCSSAAGKANGVLGQISRAINYRDKKTFVQLYKVYVRPHLEYCIQAWSPYWKADKEKLEKVQRRAVNMVAGLKGKTYQGKLREVGLTSLEDRRDRGDMIQTFRIIHGLDSVEAGTWFQMAGDRAREGAVNTRQSRDITRLVEGESHYENRRNFLSQRVPSRWNSLPESTRQQTTVLGFKAAYDGTTLMHTGQP